MKKILIVLFVIILLAAALPIVGNKLAENALSEKVELLVENGIEVKSETIDASYLQTKKHYEFLLKDSEKFAAYVNEYSHSQMPPYMNELINGVLVGTDIEYSNIPFINSVTVDAYPIALSPTMMDDIKSEDADLHTFMISFLEKKGILYHLEYDILTKDFNGYVKDIHEEYIMQDDTNLTVALSGMTYNGSGDFIAPNILSSNIDLISFRAFKDAVEVKFDLAGFSSESEFESKSIYSSSATLGNIAMAITSDENISIYSKNLKLTLSSDTEESFAKVYAKSAFEELGIHIEALNAKIYDFNYDIALNDLDKDALEELQDIATQINNAPSAGLELQIKESLIKLLSRGVTLDIDDFSFKKLVLDDTQDLNGLSVRSQIAFKEDPSLATKLIYTPLLLIQNLDADVKIKISREIFNKINDNSPGTTIAKEYAKEEGDNFVFEISFHNGELMVNGKVFKS
jgi:hypothetical protein